MSSGDRPGDQLPHEEASTREHFEQVGEAVRHEREGDRVATVARKGPRSRFWEKRALADHPSSDE